MLDSGVKFYIGQAKLAANGTYYEIYIDNSGSTQTVTVPFNATANDQYNGEITYEI